MKKKVFAMALAACMTASLTACGGSKETAPTEAATTVAAESKNEETTAGDTTEATATTEAPAAGGKLVMATNAEFPPYEYHDNNQIVGIDVEIAAAIAREMGMELEVEDISFDSIIPAVQSGKADFGAAGMTVNDDRKVNVDFTNTYAKATQVIIVKQDSEIATVDDLAGKTIGVQLGTTGDIYAEDIEGAALERYNKGFEAVQALLQGKVDAVVIDGEPAKVFIEQNTELKLLAEPLTEEEYAICVKKGNTELLDKMNAALVKLEESGELQAIIDKYISAE